MNRHPTNTPKWGIDLRPIIAYGFSMLKMSDTEISRELCVSKERVRQLRDELGISPRKCACGRTLKSKKKICCKCRRSVCLKLCVTCNERRVLKSDDDRCWKCRKADFYRTEEGRNFLKLRMRKYLEKISQDPARKEKRRAQIKEWNRRARERRATKESTS